MDRELKPSLVNKIMELSPIRGQLLFQGMELFPAIIYLLNKKEDKTKYDIGRILQKERRVLQDNYNIECHEFSELHKFVKDNKCQGWSTYRICIDRYIENE